jgi:hypothetical protein
MNTSARSFATCSILSRNSSSASNSGGSASTGERAAHADRERLVGNPSTAERLERFRRRLAGRGERDRRVEGGQRLLMVRVSQELGARRHDRVVDRRAAHELVHHDGEGSAAM